MADDLIRYDLLVQDALRGVVRRVMTDAVRDGLPGDHHFYVSFRTDFPGVRMSSRLKGKYPQDMTIVLQHQFWDLTVAEQSFEVGLSFSGIPERLFVPFEALTGFFDPSVQFGLKFELNEEADGEAETAEPPAQTSPVPVSPGRTPRGAASEPAVTAPKLPAVKSGSGVPKLVPTAAASQDKAEKPAGGKATPPAEVVSLDAFRKKN